MVVERGNDVSAAERRRKMLLDNANIPEKYAGMRFGELGPYVDDNEVGQKVMDWVRRFAAGEVVETKAKGLVLYGAPGHGKTALTAVALQEALLASNPRSWGKSWIKPYQPSRGAYMAPYRHFPTLTQRQFNNGTTEDEDNLLLDIRGARTLETVVRLLVLDDVGKEHRTSSGWAAGFFEELIRTRAYEGWPTIMTTNLMPDQWQAAYGPSCESFMYEAFEHHHVISPVGDRRKK